MGRAGAERRFTADMAYRAAKAYYDESRTQAEVAHSLGVSRPTVSRLLAEARELGIVKITVRPPGGLDTTDGLEAECAHALGLDRVYVVERSHVGNLGAHVAPGVSRALSDAGLSAGDTLLVSSGRTLYEVSAQELPSLPDVVVAPTVGGLDEPEAWWQTNEITRRVAQRVGGRPLYLHAPALAEPRLHRLLNDQPGVAKIHEAWQSARCALLGVGAPLDARSMTATFFPIDPTIREREVGDVCARFYDATGQELLPDDGDHLVAVTREQLQRIPAAIAVAVGTEKAVSLAAGARGGFFNRLVTDTVTARQIVEH